MRIVDRATFLTLPAGTVYSKFNPHTFDGLYVKDETCGNDWWQVDLVEPFFQGEENCGDRADGIQAMEDGKASPARDFDTVARDGFFDADQLFAVYDADDTRRLIERLQRALVETGAGYAPLPQRMGKPG